MKAVSMVCITIFRNNHYVILNLNMQPLILNKVVSVCLYSLNIIHDVGNIFMTMSILKEIF